MRSEALGSNTPKASDMWRGVFTGTLIVLCWLAQVARADQPPPGAASSFEKAKAIYEQSKDKAEFQQYWREFSTWDEKFNEALRRRHDCLSVKGPKTIEVLLVIPADGIIEQVLSKEDSPKVDCLRSMYAGLKVRPPPFSPTVLEFEANDYLTRMMIQIIQ